MVVNAFQTVQLMNMNGKDKSKDVNKKGVDK